MSLIPHTARSIGALCGRRVEHAHPDRLEHVWATHPGAAGGAGQRRASPSARQLRLSCAEHSEGVSGRGQRQERGRKGHVAAARRQHGQLHPPPDPTLLAKGVHSACITPPAAEEAGVTGALGAATAGTGPTHVKLQRLAATMAEQLQRGGLLRLDGAPCMLRVLKVRGGRDAAAQRHKCTAALGVKPRRQPTSRAGCRIRRQGPSQVDRPTARLPHMTAGAAGGAAAGLGAPRA